MCYRSPLVCSVCRSHHPALLSSFKTYHRICNKTATQLFPLVLVTLPPHMSSHPGFSRFRVTHYLIICLAFCWSLFNYTYIVSSSFSFSHCSVCPSIYSFWLPLWYFSLATVVSVLQYLQTFNDPTIALSMWPRYSAFLASSRLATNIQWPYYCTVHVTNIFCFPS